MYISKTSLYDEFFEWSSYVSNLWWFMKFCVVYLRVLQCKSAISRFLSLLRVVVMSSQLFIIYTFKYVWLDSGNWTSGHTKSFHFIASANLMQQYTLAVFLKSFANWSIFGSRFCQSFEVTSEITGPNKGHQIGYIMGLQLTILTGRCVLGLLACLD